MRPRLGTIWISLVLSALFTQFTFSQTDSAHFYQVKGKIIDWETNQAVAFASIFITGSSVGTVANTEGVFVLKIPGTYINDSLLISCMGYESMTLSKDQFGNEQNLVRLRAIPIPLEEVTIVNRDARDLITSALEHIRINYSNDPMNVTTFYRESIQKGRKYVAVSEAVLQGYKSSYSSIFDMDKVSIKKARKSSDFKDRDTVVLKLQGGPHTMFQLDFVKNPGELLYNEILGYYEYHLIGQTKIDNRLAHVISFHQLPEIDVPLFTGIFFIGVEDLAFMGAEFHLHEDHMDRAAEFMVKSAPVGAKIEVDKADYMINYRFFQNKWFLSYVRSEVVFKIKWEKKLLNSNFTTKIEMAVTDMDTINVVKYKKAETISRKDIFVEQVADFEDPEFWGDYNVIQPEESILSSLKRMGRNSKPLSPPGPGSNR